MTPQTIPESLRTLPVVLLLLTVGACATESPLEQLARARDLSADLAVQFAKASAAANRAVLADTDDAAAAFIRDADMAKAAVQANIGALHPILVDQRLTPEDTLLREFEGYFRNYQDVDARILGLTTENTNRKAQRLSFAEGQREADSFQVTMDSLRAANPGDQWRLKAATLASVAAVREIQALQAPHIAEADDTAMTAMEARMSAEKVAAEDGLRAAATLVAGNSKRDLASAQAAFNRFVEVHREIVSLSRRNTNVRSLALSLTEKGRIIAKGEDSLTRLRAALAKRGFTGTR